MWVNRRGDVSWSQLQPHLIPQHMARHRRSERSCHTSATVQGILATAAFSLNSAFFCNSRRYLCHFEHTHQLRLQVPGQKCISSETLSSVVSAKVLMELACFEPLRKLICGMFLPQCSPHGGVLQPCRSVCSSAEQHCSQALDLFSFSWPFNCHLLPDTQDPMECSLPWSPHTHKRGVSIVLGGLVGSLRTDRFQVNTKATSQKLIVIVKRTEKQ